MGSPGDPSLLFNPFRTGRGFSFTGNASVGNDEMRFQINGSSLSLSSLTQGPGGVLTSCTLGVKCNLSSMSIGTGEFDVSNTGSSGTVNGVVAQILNGGLTFSATSFITGSNPQNPGSGTVTFNGTITGYLFLPSGCVPGSTCTDIGPQVFRLHLTGTGTAMPSGSNGFNSQNVLNIDQIQYEFDGTATLTAVPEPSSMMMLAGGLLGVAGVCRRRLKMLTRRT